MIKLYGAICGTDIESLRTEIPAQWLTAWDACHKVGKNEKAACLSLSALALLYRAGVTGTFAYGENGRPFFSDCTCDFSITHTQNHVFCAVIAGKSEPSRIGIDAEDLDRPDFSNAKELAVRWFTQSEREIFLASPTKETFLSLWTRKEAYVKYTGEGLKSLSKIDTVALDADREVRFFDYRIGDILISVCAPRGADAPENFTF